MGSMQKSGSLLIPSLFNSYLKTMVYSLKVRFALMAILMFRGLLQAQSVTLILVDGNTMFNTATQSITGSVEPIDAFITLNGQTVTSDGTCQFAHNISSVTVDTTTTWPHPVTLAGLTPAPNKTWSFTHLADHHLADNLKRGSTDFSFAWTDKTVGINAQPLLEKVNIRYLPAMAPLRLAEKEKKWGMSVYKKLETAKDRSHIYSELGNAASIHLLSGNEGDRFFVGAGYFNEASISQVC